MWCRTRFKIIPHGCNLVIFNAHVIGSQIVHRFCLYIDLDFLFYLCIISFQYGPWKWLHYYPTSEIWPGIYVVGAIYPIAGFLLVLLTKIIPRGSIFLVLWKQGMWCAIVRYK